MIEFLHGKLSGKTPSSAVVEVGGVGFSCLISLSTYDELPACGESVRLWAHLMMRDEQPVLFGFATIAERWLFRQLITVNGVGPRLAITILSGAPTGSIRTALADGNSDRLKAIRGIGARTADRIILELQKKMGDGLPDALGTMAGGSADQVRQAVDALGALGFTQNEAARAVAAAAKRGADTVEELIKESLRTG